MLDVGSRIPDVTLAAQEGEPVGLLALAAAGAMLLAFYLFDWTGTWRSELRLLRDRSEEFDAAGVRIFGISRDSPYSHDAYAARQGLTYPLLSDWSGDAVRAFGVAQTLDGLDDVPRRSCFLVDADGVVRFAKVYGDDEVPDLDELLEAAQRM